ncbi:MAG: hypothetical protein WCR60_03425, partial [Patescibacteria group bacterium]
TKLLAIISNDFPRIKMTETELEEYEKSKDSDDEESEPVKAPFEAIWELVGYGKNNFIIIYLNIFIKLKKQLKKLKKLQKRWLL